VSVGVDDASGRLGLSHLELLEIVDELALGECVSNTICHLFRSYSFGADACDGEMRIMF
jgi:hypothetical protein